MLGTYRRVLEHNGANFALAADEVVAEAVQHVRLERLVPLEHVEAPFLGRHPGFGGLGVLHDHAIHFVGVFGELARNAEVGVVFLFPAKRDA